MRSIRYKLLCSFIGIALLSFPINLYFIINFNKISNNFLFLYDYQLPRMQALVEMKNTMLRVNLFISSIDYISGHIKSNDSTPTQLGAAKDQLLAYLGEIGEWQKKYQQNLLFSEEPSLAINQLNLLRNDLILKALNLFSYKEQKVEKAELIKRKLALEKAQENLEYFINNQINAEGLNLEQIKEDAKKAWLQLKSLAMAASILVLVAAFIIATILTRWITMPIISLRDFTHNITQDNLECRTPIYTKDEIGELATSINTMLQNLSQAKSKIIETSRLAGVAEVATNVIHNVGNILNSVNTSVSAIMNTTNQSKINLLGQLFEMIESHKNDLVDFLNNDERGKLVLPYFQEVIQNLEQGQLKTIKELDYLQANLNEIKKVVTMQLSSGLSIGIIEQINISELIDTVLNPLESKIKNSNIALVFNRLPITHYCVKSKLQQILVHLIKNAIEALVASENPRKKLTITLESLENNFFRISIQDNGIGVLKENLDQIFSFGFTTKEGSHGYGLHSCALLATELGGKLSVESEGLEKGTTFILELPDIKNHIATK